MLIGPHMVSSVTWRAGDTMKGCSPVERFFLPERLVLGKAIKSSTTPVSSWLEACFVEPLS
jgi:hypothetical protein